MKAVEKKQALILRSNGWSINDICRKLNVAKSSVSIWVRDVELTDSQKVYLETKGHFNEVIEKRRKSRLLSEKLKRDLVINAAMKNVPKLSKRDIWYLGVALYLGEGSKTRRNVCFSNSDAKLIKIMMLFFRDVCGVPEEKLRGYINIHPHLDHKKAEVYWSTISGIPLERFFKTHRVSSKSSLGKKDTLPYGTFAIYVYDTQLFFKIVGWTRGISSRLLIESIPGFGAEDRSY